MAIWKTANLIVPKVILRRSPRKVMSEAQARGLIEARPGELVRGPSQETIFF